MSAATTKAGNTTAATHDKLANAIRALSMDAVQAANSGHPGMPMGMADVATVLYREHLKFDAANPDWPNRDRFVLSAGHGSMLLYALLYLTGTPGMTIDEIKKFRQLGSKTAGHPEYGHAPGIETTTGPLGQGVANAVGMALAERLLNARHGDDLINHNTYCIAGDGCLMEGISHEAISLAGHLKLGKLIVLFDDNSISIDGSTDLSVSDNQCARFEASGWNALKVDGHDPAAISKAIATAKGDPTKPWFIACKTIIGYGAPTLAGTAKTHGSPLGAEEIAGAREKLGWNHPPFDIPKPILDTWRDIGKQGASNFNAWQKSFDSSTDAAKTTLTEPVANVRSANIEAAITKAKSEFAADEKERATRVWSQLTLEHLIPAVPELLGGSADLTGSNGTKTSHYDPISASNFAANYLHFGVREHAMAAIMNGMALTGGTIPFGATFLVFTDYCRPSIRLTALMEQQVIYIMTHDSIGLGEDGPTHQPVEHLSSLRAIPNLLVLRPADPVETAEAWQIALENTKTPTVMALTRQGVPLLRDSSTLADNKSRTGAYLLRDPSSRDVTLIATGSEVGLAIEAADTLTKEGINAAVVSMPSMELFREQSHADRAAILGTAPRIAIEAGVQQSWFEWLRDTDAFVGMTSFGASAPAEQLYEHFGITAKRIVEVAKKLQQTA